MPLIESLLTICPLRSGASKSSMAPATSCRARCAILLTTVVLGGVAFEDVAELRVVG